jgi:hypothetical protein
MAVRTVDDAKKAAEVVVLGATRVGIAHLLVPLTLAHDPEVMFRVLVVVLRLHLVSGSGGITRQL